MELKEEQNKINLQNNSDEKTVSNRNPKKKHIGIICIVTFVIIVAALLISSAVLPSEDDKITK